jgi:hypothetical protein
MHHGKTKGDEIEGKDEHADHGKGDPRKKDGNEGVLHERKI